MTFSIVVRDPLTGALGVATATGGPAVGSLVPHARAGIGAIATQSWTNPYLAYDGLDLLKGGDAASALDRVIAADADRDLRQLIIVDASGRTAAWTGPACTDYAHAIALPDIAVAGNMLSSPAVLPAMLQGFGAAGAFADRLAAALSAGHEAGGDARGIRSAALKIYETEAYPVVDLRVDWSDEPLSELMMVLEATRHTSYARFFADLPRRRPGSPIAPASDLDDPNS